MTKELIIIFVKNIKLGKVKTRLAKTIGNQGAFEVYKELVKITEGATKSTTTDKRIYFSDAIIENKWKNDYKAVQEGENLGERMRNAFKKGFEEGYERIVLIGSDLPDITSKHIINGLEVLKTKDLVFGPAEDGGYYLIGLSKMNDLVFDNKPWSQPQLLQVTLKELVKNNMDYALLETLNDIDTYEDLVTSAFYKLNPELQKKLKQFHD
ncbi:TIGR04282 family arsenosugar biosynthesis glycosyltransferase [Changchengzhania lutea]|uniref:TIGR04282 family arsenosugar biosynthesis glycosyltransferase n=1 Tax=Changchengzhania lutea TaxID=2049305 RepID=UPI001C8F64BF|nr:TIGR04282 family arsenosugar biosynthesis glycosyltransferase [Changchengzhania lutea]